jgi:predicted permease
MSWRRFLNRRKWDRERREEIESYIQIETDNNLARGMPEQEARFAARRKFGNATLAREEIYRMNTVQLLDSLVRAARHAVRALRRNPGFTLVAVLTLALGIGANTAIFSVVNGVLIKPLSYPHSDRLVAIWYAAPGAGITGDFPSSPGMYFTYREHSRVFQDVGMWSSGGTTVTGIGDPEQVRTVWATYGLLQALGVQPFLGRWFSEADDSPSGTNLRPVILAYGYWQRRFGGDRSVIGRTVTIDSIPNQIIGVMPENFRFYGFDPELIQAMRFDRSRAFISNFNFAGIARLRPGTTLAQANADVERMLPIWISSTPLPPLGTAFTGQSVENWRLKPTLRPLQQDVVGSTTQTLWVLMGTIGIVLLIACANVANLLLVRAESRQQEMAIRAALGARRGEIARELLTESLILACLGGALGLGFAYAGLRLLAAIGPSNLPRLAEISIDWRVLGFAAAASLSSGLLFGLAPILKYAGPRAAAVLRSGGRAASQSRERHRTRNVLVVIQVALASLLLVGAVLMIRTFDALRRVEPGFTAPGELQIVRINILPSQVQDPEQVTRLQEAILRRIAAVPGVVSAAFSSDVPMDGRNNWDAVSIEDKTYGSGRTPPPRKVRYISPGFFQTMGTRLIAGRDIDWTDIYGHRPVVLISENMARELWGSPAAALGKRVHESVPPDAPWREIVGVVQDVRNEGVHKNAPTIVYWPSLVANLYATSRYAQRAIGFSIRSKRAGNESFLKDIRQAIWSVNGNLPVFLVRTQQQLYDSSLAATSFTLVMLAIAGAMALLLGIVGIYGVISYVVSQRRREIGIRVALGAQSGEVKRMFVRYGLVLAVLGIACGLGASVALTRLMVSLLFGISPLDPMTYAAVPIILATAAVLASYLPAQRAAAVDPAETLRAE